MSDPTLYEQLGGKDAINAAVDIFYDEKVLKDPLLAPYFDSVDMVKQKNKQKAFLAFAFGAPTKYEGKDMRTAHAKLVERGIDDRHVDAVIKHLGDTLKQLGVADELIAKVAAIAESVRDDVLGR